MPLSQYLLHSKATVNIITPQATITPKHHKYCALCHWQQDFSTLLVSKDSERNILPISNLLLIALLDSIGLFCSLWLETSKRKEKCTASCAFFRYLPGMPHHHLLVPPLPMTQQCLPKYRESSSRISIISDELR